MCNTRRNAFCFVQFKSSDSAILVLSKSSHRIGNYEFIVKAAYAKHQPDYNANGEKNDKHGALATKLELQTEQSGIDDIPTRKLLLTHFWGKPIKPQVNDRFFNDNSFHVVFRISWEVIQLQSYELINVLMNFLLSRW